MHWRRGQFHPSRAVLGAPMKDSALYSFPQPDLVECRPHVQSWNQCRLPVNHLRRHIRAMASGQLRESAFAECTKWRAGWWSNDKNWQWQAGCEGDTSCESTVAHWTEPLHLQTVESWEKRREPICSESAIQWLKHKYERRRQTCSHGLMIVFETTFVVLLVSWAVNMAANVNWRKTAHMLPPESRPAG